MSQQQSVSAETAKAILDAFNAHDLDAIMRFFADDCSLDMPRGPDPWGQRFVGKAAVREGLATRFKGLCSRHRCGVIRVVFPAGGAGDAENGASHSRTPATRG